MPVTAGCQCQPEPEFMSRVTRFVNIACHTFVTTAKRAKHLLNPIRFVAQLLILSSPSTILADLQ